METRRSIEKLSRFERSPITQLLLERLLLLEPGDMVTYEELSDVAAEDIRDGAYHLLRSAREIALKDHDVVTDAVTNEGVKRLDDRGAVEVAFTQVGRIHRTARRSQRVLQTIVDPSVLPTEQRKRYDAVQLQAGVLRLFSGRDFRQRSLKAVDAQQALPRPEEIVRDSMRIFKD